MVDCDGCMQELETAMVCLMAKAARGVAPAASARCVASKIPPSTHVWRVLRACWLNFPSGSDRYSCVPSDTVGGLQLWIFLELSRSILVLLFGAPVEHA